MLIAIHRFVSCTFCFQICQRLKAAQLVEVFDAKVNGKVNSSNLCSTVFVEPVSQDWVFSLKTIFTGFPDSLLFIYLL